MNSETSKLLNWAQGIVEIGVAVGYLIGLIPFAYLWSSGWILPLIVVSFVLSLLNRNGTTTYTVVNFVLALASFIPVLGYVTRILGILVSGLTIVGMRRHR